MAYIQLQLRGLFLLGKQFSTAMHIIYHTNTQTTFIKVRSNRNNVSLQCSSVARFSNIGSPALFDVTGVHYI